MRNNRQISVTGAAGFVGYNLCRELQTKQYAVLAIVRRPCLALSTAGIEVRQHDLRFDPQGLAEIFSGCQTVFHVASKVDMWGKYDDFYQANVVATQNVIDACRQAGVKNLIYTSSPSVVADGSNLCGINEEYPVPERHAAFYPATKAIAEKLVLAANSEQLRTVALRPHLIFGPGDRHFIPTILDRARKGRMLIIGEGKNLVDVCFIEDCVRAHLCAMTALEQNSAICGGKAFFISQGQPIGLWDFINKVLAANQLPPLSRKVSKKLAMHLAAVFEFVSQVSPVSIKPLFTKFLVSEMTTDHYFDISAAKELLGFQPHYSVDEALQITFAVQP